MEGKDVALVVTLIAAGIGCVIYFVQEHRAARSRLRAALTKKPHEPWVPADRVRLFASDATWTKGLRREATTHVVKLANVSLPSGRIVACDPLARPDTPAFARSVPAGTYPVDLAVAKGLEENAEVYAALRVVFAPGTPTAWEVADSDRFGDDAGIPVDAGVACVMSTEAQTRLVAASDSVDNYYDDVLARELDAGWTDHRPKGSADNCVIVSSGYGDGIYPCYWGLDDEGTALWLVIDFEVVS